MHVMEYCCIIVTHVLRCVFNNIALFHCCDAVCHVAFPYFSHIRPLGAAGALAIDICICFHDIES